MAESNETTIKPPGIVSTKLISLSQVSTGLTLLSWYITRSITILNQDEFSYYSSSVLSLYVQY